MSKIKAAADELEKVVSELSLSSASWDSLTNDEQERFVMLSKAQAAYRAAKQETEVSCAVSGEWFDRGTSLPPEGTVVTLISHAGKMFQATKDRFYVGGFKIQNCGGGECVGLHWGNFWTYAHVAHPKISGQW